MAKKNVGCLTLAVIWAGLVTWYYVIMFDYEHNHFSWLDSIIAITAVIVLIGGVERFSKKDDKKTD